MEEITCDICKRVIRDTEDSLIVNVAQGTVSQRVNPGEPHLLLVGDICTTCLDPNGDLVPALGLVNTLKVRLMEQPAASLEARQLKLTAEGGLA